MKQLVVLLGLVVSSDAFQWICQGIPENETSSDENGKPFCRITNLTAQHLELGKTMGESPRINLLLDNVFVDPRDLWIEDYFSCIDYLAICNTNFSLIPVMPGVKSLAMITVNFSHLSIGSGSNYRLEVLRLWETSMEGFPADMNRLTQLRSIEGESNSLESLDFSPLSGLHNLKLIALKEGMLSSLVIHRIIDLPKLTRLDLSSNLITEIPTGLESLAALETLQLPGNRITSIEMTRFNGMDKLKDLDLSNNPVTRVDTTAAIHLPMLEHIWLQNCYLKELDVVHWDMPSLKKLDLQLNELSEVANFAGRFGQKIVLVISRNDWYCSWLNLHQEEVIFEGDRESEDYKRICPRKVQGFCCRESGEDRISSGVVFC